MGYTIFVNGSQPALNATNLKNMQIELMKMIFPLGSTYITQDDTNPSTILEFGTWERLKGKVLVGLDEDDEAFNEISKEGGEKSHELTRDELPAERLDVLDGSYLPREVNVVSKGAAGANWPGLQVNEENYPGTGNNKAVTEEMGGGQSHNNLQPYRVVGYMWIRTA